MVFMPDESPELPDNIEEGVDEDGIVEGHMVETYYHAFEKLIDGNGYVRVVADGDFTDIETRIPYASLEALGWSKESS
jgi:hypothetical protein